MEKIISELSSQLDNKQKVNRNLLTDDDVFPVVVDGTQLLVVHVPEADYQQKPIYLYGNKVDHSYKRTFEGDAHLTDEELSMMLRDAIYGESDLMLMEHYDMRHIDAETLRKYRTVFNLHNPGHIYSDLDDKEFLIQLGGYVDDEISGKEGLTMAGILMFGKGLIVRNIFPNLRMDYIDTTGLEEGIDGATQFAQSCGGGGASSDLQWGRNPEEDDRRFAYRCMTQAHKMLKPTQPKRGVGGRR